MHMTYPFMSLVMGVGVPGPKQVNILHLGVPTNLQTPYDPVGGPQVPKEAHGKHLFVPGAGAVGQINTTHG